MLIIYRSRRIIVAVRLHWGPKPWHCGVGWFGWWLENLRFLLNSRPIGSPVTHCSGMISERVDFSGCHVRGNELLPGVPVGRLSHRDRRIESGELQGFGHRPRQRRTSQIFDSLQAGTYSLGGGLHCPCTASISVIPASSDADIAVHSNQNSSRHSTNLLDADISQKWPDLARPPRTTLSSTQALGPSHPSLDVSPNEHISAPGKEES